VSYELVVVGSSWGGLRAVGLLLEGLGDSCPAAIVIGQHRGAEGGGHLAGLLQRRTSLRVRDAEDKDDLVPGTVYLAPTDYHTLIESGGTIALSTEEEVRYARPSIDVLFRSAAEAFRERCVGVVLTGASADGAAGLNAICRAGGAVIVQEPESAERHEMPEAALLATPSARILPLERIADALVELVGTGAPR